MTKKSLLLILLVAISASANAATFAPISDRDESSLKSPPPLKWGADPFAKLPGFVKVENRAGAKPEDINLSAIIYDPKDPMAVINGESVETGDYVDIYEVKEIGPQYVVLDGAGRRFELTMPPPKATRKRSEIRPLSGREGAR